MSKLLLDRRALLVAGFSSVTLSACSGLIGPPEPAPLYMLKPTIPPASGGPRAAWQLSIALPEVPDSLDTDRIALVQPGNVLDYYADASWNDRLPFLVQSALLDAFDQSGRISGVGRDTDGLKSDYILETDIRDFQAWYDSPDGIPTATVRIAARLIAARGRSIVQTLNAHAEIAASQNSVPAAVAAFNEALGRTVGQIVDWAVAAPPPPRPG